MEITVKDKTITLCQDDQCVTLGINYHDDTRKLAAYMISNGYDQLINSIECSQKFEPKDEVEVIPAFEQTEPGAALYSSFSTEDGDILIEQ